MTNPSAQTMLEPCPFCGGAAMTSDGEQSLNVHCSECDAEGGWFRGDACFERAAKHWNTRAASSPAAVRVPKVRTSHHRNKEEAERLQRLVAKRYATPEETSEPEEISGEEMDLIERNALALIRPEEASPAAGETNKCTFPDCRCVHAPPCPHYTHTPAAPPAAQADGLEEIIADLRRDKLRLIEALEFIRDGYDNHDVNHVDYRVKVYQVALDALAAASPSPQVTEAMRHDG